MSLRAVGSAEPEAKSPSVFRGWEAVPWIRNRRARKIERITRAIDHHLHLMRRKRVARIVEWMRRGNDPDLGIPLQEFHQAIDQSWIDQWLVALHIDDDRKFL